MNDNLDLFGEASNNNAARYPDAPGYKGEAETGREAAEAMAPKLGRYQRLVAEVIGAQFSQGMTPEESSAATGIDRVVLQPRFSELKRKGIIVDSGMRRRNPSSGKNAIVWVLAEYAPDPEGEAA